ncbi:MAG: FecR family protein [Betaproteobacteria bacterium]|nr:FecR family protein [Betaproteobacteria bacterium]
MKNRLILAVLGAVLATPLGAQGQAGRVLVSIGDVVAQRGGQAVPLAAGSAVASGDTIRLGPASNAQVLMTDESIISLRERTVFRLDDYVYSGKIDGSEKSIFSLLAGGMRTVTGLIGRLHSRDKYELRTPTATIGIRGTHYTLLVCNNDCGQTALGARDGVVLAEAGGVVSDAGPLAQISAPGGGSIPNGTYGGVTDGRIGVLNNTGEHEFGAQEFFHVASLMSAPERLLAPPSFLYDRLSGRSRSKERGKERGETLAQGGINADSRSGNLPPPALPSSFLVTEKRDANGATSLLPPQRGGFAAGTYSGLGGLFAEPEVIFPVNIAGSNVLPNSQIFDSSGLRFYGSFEYCGSVASICFAFLADRGNLGSVVDHGGVPGVVDWGQWVDGAPFIALLDWWSESSFAYTARRGVHYVVGVPTNPMPSAGTGQFTLLGATSPSFSDGVGGGLGRGSVTSALGSVDFASNAVNATLDLSFFGSSGRNDYTMNINGSGSSSLFAGYATMTHNNGALNVCGSSCSGSSTGQFFGANASHMGLVYDIYASRGGFYLDGAAVLRRK